MILFFSIPDIVVIEKAITKKLNFSDCVFHLNRLTEDDIREAIVKEKLRLVPKIGTVRSNVCWLPTLSSTKKILAEALITLGDYRDNNGILPSVARRNVERQRAKSMIVSRTDQSNNSGANLFTMDDMHLEFKEKYSRPNRGLKPRSDRQLLRPQLRPKATSECQQIYQEFQAKIAQNL